VSIKVATADGGVDVTQVIAGIDWVVQHRRDNGLNIRVINLSYGTNSRQAWASDPLSYAVAQAWMKGIVVVAAAGNTGYQRGNSAPGLADPAYNPLIIGVGAYDTGGTADRHDDVIVPCSASSSGARSKDPDFVAPGAHLQGLRVPNSYIDATHPEGRLGDRLFRGTGTSEATAVTSGAIALVLQKYPGLTPDQVKRFITNNTAWVAGFNSRAQGAGELNLAKMLTRTPSTSHVQEITPAKGNGTVEGARGTDHISRDGIALSGERDIFGQPISSTALASAEATGSSWTGGTWNGSSWTGSSWTGSSWTGSSWTGSSWTGSSWTGSSWTGSSWTGSSWTSADWSGSSWSGDSWSGDSWATRSWT
jgi:serine protease AprX